jgi:hypothetical protein
MTLLSNLYLWRYNHLLTVWLQWELNLAYYKNFTSGQTLLKLSPAYPISVHEL